MSLSVQKNRDGQSNPGNVLGNPRMTAAPINGRDNLFSSLVRYPEKHGTEDLRLIKNGTVKPLPLCYEIRLEKSRKSMGLVVGR